MKFKKKMIGFALILTIFCGIIICQNNVNSSTKLGQETRTVEYNQMEFDENAFNDFDNHSIVQTNDGINIEASKRFSTDIFGEIDLVGLDDTTENFVVNYEINYIEAEDTVFLSATIIGQDEIPIIDTIPGLVSINSTGESDILFSIDDELIWLSEFNDFSVIDNTGWFKNLIKKITNKVVKVSSEVVKTLEPIIRPAVNIATYFAVKLLGKNNAAYLGATILNMKADTEGIYHAGFNCWQQYFGYTDLYDVVFDASTSMDKGKYTFDVNGDGYDD